MFANAVGGGMSSRLFQEVRETRGLAYAIHAFHWGYSDTGLFGFYAATGARDVAQLCRSPSIASAQAANDLSEAEVRRAKAQMKVSLLAALESPSPRCEQIARQVMAFGRVLSRAGNHRADRCDSTIADVAPGRAALCSAPTVSAIGPVGKVLTPGSHRETLRGVVGRRPWLFSASARAAKMSISSAATAFICGRPKCATIDDLVELARSAAALF